MSLASTPAPLPARCTWPGAVQRLQTRAAATAAGAHGGLPGLRAQLTQPAAASASAVRFRPCIDIHQGKVKQIVGSTLKDDASGDSAAERPVTNFETNTSAAEFARRYAADGLPGGHVIMLSQDAGSLAAARQALAAYPQGMHVGGGVTAENAATFLDAGASHVIVTSYVFREGGLDQERLQQLVRAIGASRLVLDLSCRARDGRYYVCTDRWQRFTDLQVDARSLAALAASCSEFLVHGVDVEGKKLGIDADLVAHLGQHSPLPVTYAGGAATLADLDAVAVAGGGRVDVTVGSALDIFGGKLPYDDVVSWHLRQQRGG